MAIKMGSVGISRLSSVELSAKTKQKAVDGYFIEQQRLDDEPKSLMLSGC